VRDGALHVTPSSPRLRLTRRVNWAASQIDRVLIQLDSRSSIRTLAPRLLWAGPGEKFDEGRSLLGSIRKKNRTEIVFEVGSHGV